MANTKIQRCKCEHPYQDKRYGLRKRVFNKTDKGHKCTVCGRETE